jgi:hypothetical protein
MAKRALLFALLFLAVLLAFASPALAWPDVPAEDQELTTATNFMQTLGIAQGYPDGTFRPEAPLQRNHVALMTDHWSYGNYVPDSWYNDFTIVTRGEAHFFLPTVDFRETRWSEPLTRGQAARLLYRAWLVAVGVT